MPATPRFTTRQDLPYLIEVGRDTIITCPVYYAGALVAPVSGTVAVYDDTGIALAAPTVAALVGSVAEATVLGADTTTRSPSSGWRVEWTLTGLAGASGDVVFTSSAYLVRRRLFPTISDDDIGQRIPSLAISFAGRPTIAANYQYAIDEADTEVQRRLLEDGRRPWLVSEPWALRETWLCFAIAVIFEGLRATAGDNDPYTERAKRFREMAEVNLARAKTRMDWGQDGDATGSERQGLRASGTWLC